MPRFALSLNFLFISLIVAIIFKPSQAFSQSISTDKLIQGFKFTGVHQTEKFSALCSDLLSKFDERKFNIQATEVQEYLQKNANPRVQVRMFMYERFAYPEMKKPDPLNTATHYFEIIKLASQLQDEQLLSELYGKYAQLCPPSKKLYYLLKCIKIREHIGVDYFTDVSANYYSASELLYSITDYKSSASYAVRGIKLYKENERRDFLFQYILAADYAGASYLKTNQPDSAIYYYTHIKNLIEDRIARPSKYKSPITPETLDLWLGLVKGGIGKAYLLQKNYDGAYKLLLENLKLSTAYKQWADVAEVQNYLATIDEKQHTGSALSRYLNAYQLALKSNNIQLCVSASRGISSAFAKQGRFDSAYVYYQRYSQWKELVDKRMNQTRLDIIKAQVDFETINKSLLESQNNLINQKRIRNSILAVIIFLTAIALLLYNRKRLQMKLENATLEKEKQKSETEKVYAEQQIIFFVQNIAEKNKLIKQMQTQLSATNNSEINLALSQFTILTEDDWQKFKINFETINPGFLHRLKQKMPQITQAEQRIVLLTKLGFTTKEMANATGVSPETIRSVSSRMRKKFNLAADLHKIAMEI